MTTAQVVALARLEREYGPMSILAPGPRRNRILRVAAELRPQPDRAVAVQSGPSYDALVWVIDEDGEAFQQVTQRRTETQLRLDEN